VIAMVSSQRKRSSAFGDDLEDLWLRTQSVARPCRYTTGEWAVAVAIAQWAAR